MAPAPFRDLVAMDLLDGRHDLVSPDAVRDMGSPAGAPHDMATVLQEEAHTAAGPEIAVPPFPRDAFKLPPQGEPMGGAKQSGLGRGGIGKAFYGNGRGGADGEVAPEARRSRPSGGGRVLGVGGLSPPPRP